MKLLFGYDGSSYADAALDDLRRAGIPPEVEALVVSVGDAFINTPLAGHEVIERTFTSTRAQTIIEEVNKQACQSMKEANKLAANASERLYSFFPDWLVRVETLSGVPSAELIRKADEWDADLIVVGSQGRSALARFFLGSVSQTVVTESRCSVRVARRAFEKEEGAPPRIIVGVDGSPGAERAVLAVSKRVWPDGTEVRLITASDPHMAGARTPCEWAEQQFSATNVRVSIDIKSAEPFSALIDEVQKWEADSVFVGSVGLNHVEQKSGLGSVATGLVTNAPCSVEVVR